jgi:hypothetical protein
VLDMQSGDGFMCNVLHVQRKRRSRHVRVQLVNAQCGHRRQYLYSTLMQSIASSASRWPKSA